MPAATSPEIDEIKESTKLVKDVKFGNRIGIDGSIGKSAMLRPIGKCTIGYYNIYKAIFDFFINFLVAVICIAEIDDLVS